MLHSSTRQLVMTTTDELFLPSRIIYRVLRREGLLRRFSKLRCMLENSEKMRWEWIYEAESKRLAFPEIYDRMPEERLPLLASCYLQDAETLHVYVNSTLRLRKFLVFFDREISRSIAEAEYMDLYNWAVEHDPRLPHPKPEDYFRDESKIEFIDIEPLLKAEGAQAMEMLRRQQEEILKPLTRHRLEVFYEDGEEHFVQAGRLREFLALKQRESGKPIRPYETLLEAFSRMKGQPAEEKDPDVRIVNTNRLRDLSPKTELDFSSFGWDSARNEYFLILDSPVGRARRYRALFGYCDNPACQCNAVELWLTPAGDEDSFGRAAHLRLHLEDRRISWSKNAPPDAESLRQSLGERLTEDDWAAATRYYLFAKAERSEPENVRGLDLQFPEEPNSMCPFRAFNQKIVQLPVRV